MILVSGTLLTRTLVPGLNQWAEGTNVVVEPRAAWYERTLRAAWRQVESFPTYLYGLPKRVRGSRGTPVVNQHAREGAGLSRRVRLRLRRAARSTAQA